MAKYSNKSEHEDLIFGFISKDPRILLHYLPLEAAIVIFLAFLGINLFSIWLLIALYLLLALVDMGVHAVFNVP